MKELVKVFNGIEIPIEVENDDIWFDVSNINKQQKVIFSNWKNNKQTKKLLSYNKSILNLNRPLIDDEVLGKNFIHKKMFISYARFVSVEFESKADDIVFDVITGSHQTKLDFSETQLKEFESQLITKENQLKESQKQIEKNKRQSYANSGDDKFCNVHRFRVDNNLNTTDEELNNIFIEENILGQKLVSKYVPCPTGEYSKYDGSSIVLNINKMKEICNNRNIKVFGKMPSLFDGVCDE